MIIKNIFIKYSIIRKGPISTDQSQKQHINIPMKDSDICEGILFFMAGMKSRKCIFKSSTAEVLPGREFFSSGHKLNKSSFPLIVDLNEDFRSLSSS